MMSSGEEQEGGHTGPAEPRRRSAQEVAVALLSATGLGAALALYMGWRYEKEYIEEWGLAFSSFSYRPHELMIASSTTLLWAATFLVAVIVGELFRPLLSLDSWFRPFAPPRVHDRRALVLIAAGGALLTVGVFVFLLVDGLLTGDYRPAMSTFWLVLIIVMGSAWQGVRAGWDPARWVLMMTVVVAMFFLLVVAPVGLGRSDARLDRQHIDRLPLVELALARSLGIASERVEDGHVLSGPWRVVRTNDGRIWLAPDEREPEGITQIDLSDVNRITYLGD